MNMYKVLACVCVAIALLHVAPMSASAQTTAPWAVGKQVMVSLTDGSAQAGKLVSISSAEVVVLRDGRTVRFPLATVRRITVSERPMKKSVLIGLLVGAIAGPMVIRCTDSECPETSIMLPISIGIGAGVGAAIGAVVARARPARTLVVYETDPTPIKFSMTPYLTPDRKGLAFTVRW
jgi:hypothetical protein